MIGRAGSAVRAITIVCGTAMAAVFAARGLAGGRDRQTEEGQNKQTEISHCCFQTQSFALIL